VGNDSAFNFAVALVVKRHSAKRTETENQRNRDGAPRRRSEKKENKNKII